LGELTRLTRLAQDRGTRVMVAMNTLLKPGDLGAAARLVDQLQRVVRPDGLIVQDLGMLELARQVGFTAAVHFSTLACVSTASGLAEARRCGASRVVLPRELHLDEIKLMARDCPPELDLEVFVHGALCYGVSGRCYWSSYMGGKSGLRGRCVQPCRRLYSHEGSQGFYFSCLDLSLDVLVKTLLDIPRIRAWKIEGRKKSAHYVFYTVTAYRILRDAAESVRERKEAARLLEMALGRPGSHAGFLPQRSYIPLDAANQQGSGLVVGHVPKDARTLFIRPRLALQPGDLLRVGAQDQPWHRVVRVTRYVPKGGRFDLVQGIDTRGKGRSRDHAPKVVRPPAGTPTRLIDRRDPELRAVLRQLEQALGPDQDADPRHSAAAPVMPQAQGSHGPQKSGHQEMRVTRRPQPRERDRAGVQAMWLDPRYLERMNQQTCARLCWWLPPVIWPDEEEMWQNALRQVQTTGARFFVCNAPWQIALFDARLLSETTTIWAGPFCNVANALSIDILRQMGFAGVVISPELDKESVLALPRQASIPLGVVVGGYWPLCVSRWRARELAVERPVRSPKSETAWSRQYFQNLWTYPDWPLDLGEQRTALIAAGYKMFVDLEEKLPANMDARPRPSRFNWDLRLL